MRGAETETYALFTRGSPKGAKGEKGAKRDTYTRDDWRVSGGGWGGRGELSEILPLSALPQSQRSDGEYLRSRCRGRRPAPHAILTQRAAKVQDGCSRPGVSEEILMQSVAISC